MSSAITVTGHYSSSWKIRQKLLLLTPLTGLPNGCFLQKYIELGRNSPKLIVKNRYCIGSKPNFLFFYFSILVAASVRTFRYRTVFPVRYRVLVTFHCKSTRNWHDGERSLIASGALWILVHKLSIRDFQHIHVDPGPTFHVDIDFLLDKKDTFLTF